MFTFLALSTVLLAFAGLVTDVGMMEYYKRKAQVAADAGALGGYADLASGGTNPAAAAAADVTTNGFTDGVSGTTVTVNKPPASGTYAGNSNYIEVIVSQSLRTTFMKILGVDTMMVRARAVAGRSSGGGCIYALNPTKSKALVASGSAAINAACRIIVDSSNDDALDISGSACVSGSSIDVTGDYNSSSGCGPSPTPNIHVDATADPLADVPAPAVGACDHTGTFNGNGQTMNPGVYCGGIKVSGGATGYFNPGTYILLGGGLNVSGGSNVSGTGVFFYNTGNGTYAYKPIVVSGGSLTTLSAPTTGTYAGILFFQDRSISSSSQNTVSGTSSAGFTGALYFPTTPLVYSGGSYGNAPYTILIADTITFSGGSNINNDYSSLPGGSPVGGAGGAGLAE